MEARVYSLVQETLVRDLLYESPVALLVVDDEMRILVANEAAADLSGYSVDELTRLQSWQITGDPEQSARNAERVHLGGRLASQSKVRHKDGHIVPCSYFAWEVTIGVAPVHRDPALAGGRGGLGRWCDASGESTQRAAASLRLCRVAWSQSRPRRGGRRASSPETSRGSLGSSRSFHGRSSKGPTTQLRS